jgi:quercetin dioxygenase-like cupin family protein
MQASHREWVPNPGPAAWREPLARGKTESGQTTGILRFDPGSFFSRHDHPLGEEILVLEGTFSDE